MALFGLFGKKDPQANQEQGAYYLDFEQAQTFGNAEYMKKKVTIERTFPNTKSQKGGRVVKEVSASEFVNTSNPNTNLPPVTPATETEAPVESQERRNTDTSLDMFRSMAKEMRK